MAHSLERRWAKLVKSYARLKELYDKSLQRESLLVDELRDARAEVRELRRTAKEHERASRNSFEHLLATTRYAIAHLYEAGDLVAAEKLEQWLEVMEDTMQPVANVVHLVDLLDEWVAAMPCDDEDQVATIWIRSKAVIEAARGTNGSGAGE
jgi:hypothetical protein